MTLFDPSYTGHNYAILSDDGRCRFELGRQWDQTKPPMVFIMLNPSTADAELDDQTIRKCRYFANRDGCGGIKVVNVFPLRARDPLELLTWGGEGHHRNARHLAAIFDEAAEGGWPVVAAWGAWFQSHRHRMVYPTILRVGTEAIRRGNQLWCLGVTKDGCPKHPVYLPYSAHLQPFTGKVDP